MTPVESRQQENVLQRCDARGKYVAHSAATESVSSVCFGEPNGYMIDIVVETDGGIRYLGRAQQDTGCMPSLISESTAVRAEAWGLATIDRSQPIKAGGLVVFEGIVKGAEIKVEGKVSLRFSVDGAHYYRHTFLVVPDDDRFDMLLGAKLLERGALVPARQDAAKPMAGRL
ncbi:uncharacterized protein PV07_11867 [Cladophialophora immunda]|uniref:Uncharacterized protein n=1 Tax=Cladophialophora immunda TaxID=569365 RepID=A0A0D2AFN9_9EURO|nr:uncharacterized protein PV07_11867 [Cladophialophora immunda]KIW23687.1 hypothetical protein PV07_11867 [Cladophialophora immunda]